MRSPYRHSVWIDIFGVLVLGGVLLGGAGYLLYHAGSAGGNFGVGASGGSVAAANHGQTPGDAGWAPRRRRPASPRSGAGPLLGSRAGSPAPSVEAPFSADWRDRATPDLTGPSATSSDGDSKGAGSGSPSNGPTIVSSRPAGGQKGNVGGHNSGGSNWRAGARRFAGRARALSRQLGQMDRTSPETKEAASSRERALRSAAGTGAAASGPGSPGDPSRRSDPGDPSTVPIDDHVYWLAVAGLLFGIWRLRGG